MSSTWERAPATTGSSLHGPRGGSPLRYFFFALLALLAWKRGLVPRCVG